MPEIFPCMHLTFHSHLSFSPCQVHADCSHRLLQRVPSGPFLAIAILSSLNQLIVISFLTWQLLIFAQINWSFHNCVNSLLISTEALRLNSFSHSSIFSISSHFVLRLAVDLNPAPISNSTRFSEFSLSSLCNSILWDFSLDIFGNSIRIQLQFHFLRSCAGARSIDPPPSWPTVHLDFDELNNSFQQFGGDSFERCSFYWPIDHAGPRLWIGPIGPIATTCSSSTSDSALSAGA